MNMVRSTRATRWDMRLTDKHVLREIHQRPDLSQEEIAQRLQCHENTVQRAIKRMRDRSYLERVSGGGRVPTRYAIQYESLPTDLQDELK